MLNWVLPTTEQLKPLNYTSIYLSNVRDDINNLEIITSIGNISEDIREFFNQSISYNYIRNLNKNVNNTENDHKTNSNGGNITESNIQSQTRGNEITDLNSEVEDYDCKPIESTLLHLITMIMYALVSIVGLFGNTLVIYVILRFSKMQTVTNIYILNLAIADDCFLIGIPFLLHTMKRGSWTFGSYMCKAYMMSTSITQFTSSIFLLIMSADRYIAVCHPILSLRFRTPWVSKMVSTGAWLTSSLLMLPVLLFANIVGRGEHVSCNIKWPDSGFGPQSEITFILYSLILGFATPLTFIMTFYCLVIRKLQSVVLKRKSKEKRRSHRKVTTLVLTVITVYIFCWMPYWILQVVLIMSAPGQCVTHMEVAAYLFVSCLSYSNSAINPILYAFLSENFKKCFMKAFNCKNCRKRNNILQLQPESSFLPKLRKSNVLGKFYSINCIKFINYFTIIIITDFILNCSIF